MAKEDALVRVVEASGEMGEAIFTAKEINRLIGGIDMLDVEEIIAVSKEGCAVFPISQCFTARTDRRSFWKNAFGRRASLTWLQAGRISCLKKMSGVRFTFSNMSFTRRMRLRGSCVSGFSGRRRKRRQRNS